MEESNIGKARLGSGSQRAKDRRLPEALNVPELQPQAIEILRRLISEL